MTSNQTPDTPRAAVESRLREDLRDVEPVDIRSAVFCGEMGCGEREQEYLLDHPDLRCPYMDRVDDPSAYCAQLREAYQAAVEADE